jgi:hypothetical protein
MHIPTSTVALLSGWSMDWPLLGIIAMLLSLECFSAGSTRTSTISIAFPLTAILFSWLPHTFLIASFMSQLGTPVAEAALFGLILIGAYFAIHRIIFAFGSGGGDVPRSVVSGVAATIILVIFWLQTPGLNEIWQFSAQVQLIFGEQAKAWWLIGTFAILAYTRG